MQIFATRRCFALSFKAEQPMKRRGEKKKLISYLSLASMSLIKKVESRGKRLILHFFDGINYHKFPQLALEPARDEISDQRKAKINK